MKSIIGKPLVELSYARRSNFLNIALSVIVVFIFVFGFTNRSPCQEIGTVMIGTSFDEGLYKLKGVGDSFDNNKICFLFQTYSGTFGRLQLVYRVVKINDRNEFIYLTQDYEIDPDWESTYDCQYLPTGRFVIKFYDNYGKLLGKSYEFLIN